MEFNSGVKGLNTQCVFFTSGEQPSFYGRLQQPHFMADLFSHTHVRYKINLEHCI